MRLFVLLVAWSLVGWCQQTPEIQEVESEDETEELDLRWQESNAGKIQLNLIEMDQPELYQWADSSVWKKIIQHRNRTGYYFSEYEIQSILDLDTSLIKRLLPLLSASMVPHQLRDDLKQSDMQYLMMRRNIGTSGGYTGRYRRSLRSVHHLAIAFSERYGTWKFRGNGWMQISPKIRILAGHYKSDWGLGLLLGMYTPGKNAEPIYSVWHSAAEDIPWNSSGMHFRGVSLRFQPTKYWTVRVNYSDKEDPAVVRDSILRYWVWAPSKSSTWVREQSIASSLQYRNKKNETGILMLAQQTSYPQEDWGGEQFRIGASVYWRKKVGEKNMAVEVSVNDTRVAATFSLLCPLSAKLEMASNVRHIQTGYYSKYMNAFGLKYQSPKVTAFYHALRYIPNRKITLSASLDHYEYPLEKFRSEFQMTEYSGIGQFRFSKSHQLIFKIRYKSSEEDGAREQWNWQVQQSTESLPIRLKARIQGALSGGQTALAAGGELEYKKSKISLLVGVSIYRIEHYTLKQSWYERNLYLSSGFTWFYNEGENRYALLGWNLNDNVKIWLRGFYGKNKGGIQQELNIQLVYKLSE